MSKHTPGPWGILRTSGIYPQFSVHGPKGDGEVIAEVLPMYHGDGDDTEVVANANLIAAAPVMLAMLKHVQKGILEKAPIVDGFLFDVIDLAENGPPPMSDDLFDEIALIADGPRPGGP